MKCLSKKTGVYTVMVKSNLILKRHIFTNV